MNTQIDKNFDSKSNMTAKTSNTNQSTNTEIKSFSDSSSLSNAKSLFETNVRSYNSNEISPFRSMIVDQINFIQNEKAVLSTFNEVSFKIKLIMIIY